MVFSPFLGQYQRVLPLFLEVDMAYRKKMNRRKSKRDFTRKSGSHRKNFRARPMRGGIRL